MGNPLKFSRYVPDRKPSRTCASETSVFPEFPQWSRSWPESNGCGRIIPGHPRRWIIRQLPCMPLKFVLGLPCQLWRTAVACRKLTFQCEIVGVVGDIRHFSLAESGQPTNDIPLAQSPRQSGNIVIRGRADALALANALKQQVRALNGDVPVFEIHAMGDLISDSTGAAALPHAAAGGVRSRGTNPGGGWYLRRDVVLGDPAHARAGHPSGARRRSKGIDAIGGRARDVAGAGGSRDRSGGGRRSGPIGRQRAAPRGWMPSWHSGTNSRPLLLGRSRVPPLPLGRSAGHNAPRTVVNQPYHRCMSRAH